jgi:hypothetical protein
MSYDIADDSSAPLLSLNVTKNSEDAGDDWEERHFSRPSGAITKTDRKFLCKSPAELESVAKQTKRDNRYRIRKRVTDTIKDFEVLALKLSSRDREQVFKKLRDEDGRFLHELGVFAYLGLRDAGIDVEKYLANVVKDAEERRRGSEYSGEVDVEITSSSTVS